MRVPPKPPIPENEADRLIVVHELELFESQDDEAFQLKIDILSRVFRVPIAIMALTEKHEQRFKAVLGLAMRSVPRDLAICSHAQVAPYGPMVIPDTTQDERSCYSPLVTGDAGVRSYVGVPLVLEGQYAVGTLCIMDTQPRAFSPDEIRLLEDFARDLAVLLQARLQERRAMRQQLTHVRDGIELNAILETAAIGIIRIDQTGLIETANPSAVRLFGYGQSELLGRNVSMLMPEPWRSAHDGYLMQFLASRDPKVIGIGRQVEGLRKDGKLFPFNLSVSELRIGDESKFIGSVSDLTNQARADAALERERALLRSVIDSSTNPIVAVNAENEFILVNKAFADNLGVPIADMLGQKSEGFLPPEIRAANRQANAQVWATGASVAMHAQVNIRGRSLAYESTKSPLRDERGQQIGVVTMAQDVTEQSQLTEDLQALQILRDMGELFAEQGSWAIGRNSDQMTISPGFARLLGLDSEVTTISRAELRRRTHPDDHAFIDASIQRSEAEGSGFRFDYRVTDAESDVRYFRARGDAVRNASGETVQFIGITQDVTDEVLAQQKADAQQQLLGGLNSVVQSFLTTLSDTKAVWHMLLDELLSVTDAEFGFIGEVLYGVEETPCLKIHAITNLSWSAESDALFERVMAGDMMFCNPDNLIGEVMKSRAPVVVPELSRDPRRGGFPPGHPLLDNYLGIPLFRGDTLVGVVAIANRRAGINSELADFLAPFTSTCAIMIVSLRQQQERAQFEQQLIESRDQADKANKAKSIFLSSMSHELRTPLNAILGFAQLMAASRKEPLTEKQRGFVEHILNGGQHLLSLVNDVLNLAKIEAGEVTLSPEPLNLATILAETCHMVIDSARAAGIELLDEFASGEQGRDVMICADLTRTRQVLMNLLSNAIKYNRPGGSVRISSLPPRQNASGEWQHGLAVADTGIGIPVARQHRMFRAFERLGQEASGIEGSGIGLMITKQLLELMRGDLAFESAEGVGTTFYVWWPAVSASVDDPCGKQLRIKGDTDGSQKSEPGTDVGASKLVVLYVEDNPANSALMQDIVDDRDDVRLLLAADGERGLERALTEQPDLILMDINLPGISGQQAAAKLKKWTDTAHIPIVALSADATAPMVRAVNESGLFDRYLTKPFNLNELMLLLDEFIERKNSST